MEVLTTIKGKDNSAKFLFRLEDGNTIEALHMHDREKRLTFHSTVCVSSQVGCTIGCKFCATGKQGFVRNLSAKEITDQVRVCNGYCTERGMPPVDAVVFAGMGEPLLNYENVSQSIFNIYESMKINNFELATSGIVPGIYRILDDFRDSGIYIRLNISLHAPSDGKRKVLIPLNEKYGVGEIISAAVKYAEASGSKARVRYMLIKGVNDTGEDAAALTELLKDKPVKLVISKYNDNGIQGLTPPDDNDLADFYRKIRDNIYCEIFHNFGDEIHAGCGQLKQLQAGG